MTAPACRTILAARNKKRKRAVTKVVCRKSTIFACSSRLNSINQQFKLYASIANWKCTQFMLQRVDGWAAKPASLWASLIQFSAPPWPVKSGHDIDRRRKIGNDRSIGIFRRVEKLVLLGCLHSL